MKHKMMLVAVDVIVDTANDCQPRWHATRTSDGRWRFTERLITSSTEQAVEYLKHYVKTKPAPLTLELVATHISPYPGVEVYTVLPDGPRFTSGIENCPFIERAAARFGGSL